MAKVRIKKHWPLFVLMLLGVLIVSLLFKANRFSFSKLGTGALTLKEGGVALKEIQLFEDDPRKPFNWKLEAKEVNVEKDGQIIRFNDYFMCFRSNNHGEFSIKGIKGHYSKGNREFVLEGKVTLIGNQGERATLEDLIFKEGEGIIKGEKGVVVSNGNVSLEGEKLLIDINTNKLKLFSRVVMKIKDGKYGT